MISNYEEATTETVNHYHHTFTWVDKPDSGYSFDVDWQGNLLPDTSPQARENYALCQSLTEAGQMTNHGVEAYTQQYKNPATGTCQCGQHLHLNGDTTCQCGRHYNIFGQELSTLHDPNYAYDYDY